MTIAYLVTSDLDVALTKVAAGRPVLYCGPHQGAFRFESVKSAALRRFRAQPARALDLPEREEERLRRFFAGAW